MSKHYSAGMNKADSRFSSTVDIHVKKSRFNRDHLHKTTFNAGQLIPIFIDEILPGDHYDLDISYVCRMQNQITCPMDDIELDYYFFFVPNRLTMLGWQALHGENDQSAWVPVNRPSVVPVVTTSTAGGEPQGSKLIGDYYGIPAGSQARFTYHPTSSLNFQPCSALPFRGLGLIHNRWFRDQNYQAPIPVYIGNDNDELTDVSKPYLPNNPPLWVNKKHDYFTSVLPAPSKGRQTSITLAGNEYPNLFGNLNTAFPNGSNALQGSVLVQGNTGAANPNAVSFIQALRTAFQLTKLLERDARGGTRYIEMLRSHFGVEAQDYRLQYPEFLGHHRSFVHKQQVAQTSASAITGTTTPQGNIASFSVTSNHGSLFSKSFVEHGFLHGFVVARQRKTYQQAMEKFWFKRDRFDFYYPELAHITEMPVFQREIFPVPGGTTHPIFGWQEAWADYRYKPSRVSAEMRSDVTPSLDVWHYADHYLTAPVASDAWLRDNSDVNIGRTVAIPAMTQFDQFFIDIKFHLKATRCMPVYSVPGLVDHF